MTIDWQYVLWGGGLYLVSFAVSLGLVVAVLVYLPANYFADRDSRRLWVDQHPAVRGLLHIAKNAIGLCLVAAGLLLSLPGIPGQGILTVIIGVLLLDFPGKHQWEARLVRRPRVLSAINRIRRRFGRHPLEFEDDT